MVKYDSSSVFGHRYEADDIFLVSWIYDFIELLKYIDIPCESKWGYIIMSLQYQ